MTKTKNPLFSLNAQGKLGPLVISRSLSGSHKVAIKRPPANPRSPAQLAQRANYTSALEVWHTLTPAQKHEYYLLNPQIGAAPAYLNFMKVFLLTVPDQLDTLIARLNSLIALIAAGLPATLVSDSLKTREQNPLTGLATTAKQDTIITALQLIDDLRPALASVATDKLRTDIITAPTLTVQAAGGDKLFALESIIEEAVSDTNLPAGTSGIFGSPVPAGKVWVITAISTFCASNTISRLDVYIDGLAGGLTRFTVRPPVAWWCYSLTENLFLQAGDKVAAYVEGATLGDDLYLNYAGYQMDAP